MLNVFFGFRIMVGIGLYMIAAALFGCFLWWRGTLVRDALVSAHRLDDLVERLRRGDRRLGRHRKRAPALAGARHSCAPPMRSRRCRRRACSARWRCSCICYGIVFSMGIYYINRLIAQGTGRPRDRSTEEGMPSRPLIGSRGRRARSHRTERVTAMEWYLPVIWAGADRHRRRDVRDPRRLRSRHRHPVSVRAQRERSATR